MLKIVKYSRRSQLEEIFANYDPQKQTWLVSDLRTKFEFQRRLMQKQNFYIDSSVLRASDLWQLLLKRLDVQVRVASDAFIRTLLRSFLDRHSEELGMTSSAEETLVAYLNLLSPLLLHPEGMERLADWFEEQPESARRWKEWADRAAGGMHHLVREQKVLSGQWITAYLQEFDRIEEVWTQDLIVDLGGEISRVEADLLRALSRRVDVTVLVPNPTWRNEFAYLLKPYEDLEMQTQKTDIRILPDTHSPAIPTQVLRFSGMLAEIKETTARVRGWLDQGVDPADIAVIAPDIEAYWPVLQAYLEKEGVPVQKDVQGKLQSLPSVHRWLASLRAQGGGLSTADLEIAFYGEEESQHLRYEEFRSLFKSLYDVQDLHRNEWIAKAYHEKLDVTAFLSRDDFAVKALRDHPNLAEEPVQQILRELLKNASEKIEMKWNEWLGYLEAVVASKEYLIAKGNARGIVVTKLMSAHTARPQHRIFLGLAEENLKKKVKVRLGADDYFRLAQDIGFYLDNPDQSDLEFELKILAESGALQDFYFFGGTDLTGSLQSPASFWIDLKSKRGEIDELERLTVPQDTRWDQIQHSQLEENPRIEMDLGRIKTPDLGLTKLPSLSASALETFLKCPFIFASERYFKLRDLPEVDLDVDHRTRGSLAHALFEKLTSPPLRFDWTPTEVEEILENIRKEEKMIFADERLWLPLRKKHQQLAQRFLDFEKRWSQEFPQNKILAREKKFEFYLNPKSGELSLEPREHSFRIAGKIDRIDGDGGGKLALVDYKSSGASLKAHGSWIQNQQIQLLLYMWAAEKSMVGEVAGEVIGLFYYVFKNFVRKGFQVNEMAGPLFPPMKRGKDHSTEVKDKYLGEFYDLLMKTVLRISQGEIHPLPVDMKLCPTCEWRRLCRAPHLN